MKAVKKTSKVSQNKNFTGNTPPKNKNQGWIQKPTSTKYKTVIKLNRGKAQKYRPKQTKIIKKIRQNLIKKLLPIITIFDNNDITVIIKIHDLTTDIFKHLNINLWKGTDIRIRYTERILKGPCWTKHQSEIFLWEESVVVYLRPHRPGDYTGAMSNDNVWKFGKYYGLDDIYGNYITGSYIPRKEKYY